MRYFPLFDLQVVVLLTFLGLALLVLLYVAFGSPLPSNRPKGSEEQAEEHPAGISASKSPIPPLLIFLYVAFVIWAFIYVLVIGVKGDPF